MSDHSTDGMERVGCWVLERPGEPDRYFNSIYPALSEGWDGAECTVAWWYVDTGTEQSDGETQ
jgi:hypothetical protein